MPRPSALYNQADAGPASWHCLACSSLPPPVRSARSCRLTEEHPSSAVAWYAVGCYYYAAGQHANARRYFGKATSLDDAFAPAWLAFGHAFSAQDESDQVRAAAGSG